MAPVYSKPILGISGVCEAALLLGQGPHLRPSLGKTWRPSKSLAATCRDKSRGSSMPSCEAVDV